MDHYMNMYSESVDAAVCNTYVNLVKAAPMVFRIVYRIGACVSSMNHFFHIKSPVYYMNGKMAFCLQGYEGFFDCGSCHGLCEHSILGGDGCRLLCNSP